MCVFFLFHHFLLWKFSKVEYLSPGPNNNEPKATTAILPPFTPQHYFETNLSHHKYFECVSNR